MKDCPVCAKAGLADKLLECPQCNADLECFDLLDALHEESLSTQAPQESPEQDAGCAGDSGHVCSISAAAWIAPVNAAGYGVMLCRVLAVIVSGCRDPLSGFHASNSAYPTSSHRRCKLCSRQIEGGSSIKAYAQLEERLSIVAAKQEQTYERLATIAQHLADHKPPALAEEQLSRTPETQADDRCCQG